MNQIIVTAGFIKKDGKILLAQRLPHGPEGGKWEFPGGKVEQGEDPRIGLQRELLEELGIQVKVGQILEVVSTQKNDLHLILLYFDCKILAGEPHPIECQQVGWFFPEQITPLEKPDSDKRFWEERLNKGARNP